MDSLMDDYKDEKYLKGLNINNQLSRLEVQYFTNKNYKINLTFFNKYMKQIHREYSYLELRGLWGPVLMKMDEPNLIPCLNF